MKLNKKFKIIILSPHLDDAVLSLGEHILKWKKEGKKVTVITVFTRFGDDKKIPEFSEDYLSRSGFGSVKMFEIARIKEDKKVMKDFGVDYQHWDFIDAGFRGVYKSREELLSGKINKRDISLIKKIEDKINKMGKVNLLLIPYGVGGHVDHLIVRKAAEKVLKNVNYYFDVPYLWQKFEFLKLIWKIIKAKSLMNGSEEKRKKLEGYSSQYKLLVKNAWSFMEVIV